ncbi:calmodulin-binding protein [Tieghemostelium lacteum]|uniref:Calmodulin-binding protein n=1 Tax=Tieghemostelium lacteum TaxID=361077 RepID=A0A151ZA21_TIELA|nr:calmodulin-binding protein [Tieghemostelium lacteum]|eukprot:KYQ90785.1 calmodulin-binding protein [Tieghemostelium lacteum]
MIYRDYNLPDAHKLGFFLFHNISVLILEYHNGSFQYSLPSSLKVLKIDRYLLKIRPGDLPETLEYLRIYGTVETFTSKLDLPSSLKILKGTIRCNADCLPDSIRYLSLKGKASIPTLPIDLTKLKLNLTPMNQIGSFPSSLTSLDIFDNTKIIDVHLPNLIYLKLNLFYCKPPLSPSIKILKVNNLANSNEYYNLPKSLTNLDIIGRIYINRLIFADYENSDLITLKLTMDGNTQLKSNHLPKSVRNLSLFKYNSPLSVGVLPPKLETLLFDSFTHPLDPGVLPPTLIALTLPNVFYQRTQPGAYPLSLKFVKFE